MTVLVGAECLIDLAQLRTPVEIHFVKYAVLLPLLLVLSVSHVFAFPLETVVSSIDITP